MPTECGAEKTDRGGRVIRLVLTHSVAAEMFIGGIKHFDKLWPDATIEGGNPWFIKLKDASRKETNTVCDWLRSWFGANAEVDVVDKEAETE